MEQQTMTKTSSGTSLAFKGVSMLLFSAIWLLWVIISIPFLLHITTQWRNDLLLYINKRNIAQNENFFFSFFPFFVFLVSSYGIHSSGFFTFQNYFKCSMSTQWSIMSSLATSCVAIRRSVCMIALTGPCQLLMPRHLTPQLQSSHLCKPF